jgi:putative hemolysin
VALLSASTNGYSGGWEFGKDSQSPMSREELTVLLREGVITGSINRPESRMMEGVFGFEKLGAYDIMVLRTKMVWIDRHAKHDELWPEILQSTQGEFAVYDQDRDNLVGVVSIKDLYGQLAAGKRCVLRN